MPVICVSFLVCIHDANRCVIGVFSSLTCCMSSGGFTTNSKPIVKCVIGVFSSLTCYMSSGGFTTNSKPIVKIFGTCTFSYHSF
jgi:hypothetical protein